jgi:hypothetical protein
MISTLSSRKREIRKSIRSLLEARRAEITAAMSEIKCLEMGVGTWEIEE